MQPARRKPEPRLPSPDRQRTDLVVVGDCSPDVLVLGDDVTPSFGQQEKLVEGITMVIGGSAAITAVAAARLGLSVRLVAAVGADPAGDFLLGQLSREGVGTAAVAVRDDVPTGMTVALSRGADRAILTALGAVASLTTQDVPATLLTRARHVHISSYFLLQHSLGPGLAVKLGERGVLCADGPVWHRAALPPVTPVDATGAGDCFNAGLIAGLLRGLALPDAAALGCAGGALSTRAPGGTASCPDLASALALARTATVRRVSAGMLSS